VSDELAGNSAPSSRDSLRGAGFYSGTPGRWRERLDTRVFRTSGLEWASRQSLFEAANHILLKIAREDRIIADERARWVARQRRFRREDDFVVRPAEELASSWSFLLLGDTGEGDGSQYAVAEVLGGHADTEFMVIVSDVVYPAGDVNDYIDCFYIPYADYPSRIYGVPGNHDWYDLLSGFMFHFCDAEPLAPTSFRLGRYDWRERMARVHWLPSSPPRRALIDVFRESRADPTRWPKQPGPYYVLDTDELRIVCLDTGAAGMLDRQQGKWLLSVSEDPRPKIMLVGNPLVVDGKHHRCPIQWIDPRAQDYPDVASVVRNPDFFYIAVIGGDVHNYQRYPAARAKATEPAKQDVQFIVTGGGGAFLSPTHRIPRVSVELPGFAPIEEDEFRCFPLRGDSLARFSQMLGVRLTATFKATLVALAAAIAAGIIAWLLRGVLGPNVAAAFLALGFILAAIGLIRWDALRARARTALAIPLLFLALLVWATTPHWLPRALTYGLAAAFAVIAAALLAVAAFMVYVGWFVLFRSTGVAPDEASQVVGARLGIRPTRDTAQAAHPSDHTRRRVRSLHPFGESRRWLGALYGEIYAAVLDTDEPPLLRSFLRVDVAGRGSELDIRIRCFGVSGWQEDESDPPVEDEIRWTRAGGWSAGV